MQSNAVCRNSRRWYIISAYGRSDDAVADLITRIIKPELPELIEVLAPKYLAETHKGFQSANLTPGYVYLKILGSIERLRQALADHPILSKCSPPQSICTLYPDDVVRLEQMLANRYQTPQLEVGLLVEVVSGPLTGRQGKVQEILHEKVLIEMEIFNREVIVEIEPQRLRKA